jgi:hypothetical protein
MHFKYKHEKIWFFIKSGFSRRVAWARNEARILMSSRIIQFMLIMPLMYVSYRLGKQFYIEYHSYYYPGRYIRPATPIKDRVKLYVASLVKELLTDK